MKKLQNAIRKRESSYHCYDGICSDFLDGEKHQQNQKLEKKKSNHMDFLGKRDSTGESVTNIVHSQLQNFLEFALMVDLESKW